ncbi:MAG: hypothetical protein IPG28_01765 [Betaproteobacteria bacterium]|nr:hypothetical protein [Betaproteobacteria bacterium]
MQTRTHRKAPLAATAAATLPSLAAAGLWHERAAPAQAFSPASVTTDAGTIRAITQECVFS